MYFIILTLFSTFQVRVIRSTVCTHPSSSVKHFGSSCNSNSDCITQYCFSLRCRCRAGQSFDSLINLCLPNNNMNITSRSGRLFTPSRDEYIFDRNVRPEIKWNILGVNNSYVVISLLLTSNLPPFQEVLGSHRTYRYFLTLRSVYSNGSSQSLNSAYKFSRGKKTLATQLNSGLQIEVDTSYQRSMFIFIDFRVYEKDSKITETYGSIASPGYPNSYPASSIFTWTIFGKSIAFILTDLKFDGCCDSLTIYNDTSSSSAPLVKLYNETTQTTFTTSGAMYIVFETNNANQSDGFSAVFFRQDLDYEEKCDANIDGMCKPGLVCRCDKYTETRCLCPDGHYLFKENCTNALQVKSLVRETTATLTMDNYYMNFVSHYIIWSSCGRLEEKSTKYFDIFVSDLTPGQVYAFKITSTMAAGTYTDQIVLTSYLTAVTLPARPGGIITEESNLDSPPYVLKFNSSQGIVHHYNVTLVSDTQVLIYQVKEAELVTSDLTPDTLYNYTITAFNKLGNESTTFRGNVTTSPDKSVSVGVVAGITISVVVLLCCVAVVIVVLDKKRRTQITHFLRLCLGNILRQEMENNESLSKSRNKKATSGGRQLKSDPKDNKHSYDVVIVPSSSDVAGLYRDLNQSTPVENCYANSSAVKQYLDNSRYEDM
ncbi:cubilin-like isoform X2 [Biomphalaria pfeifferi]|uniref:Cubilin-like isoform X2 n=1 Tax=Biomphalaria pfeifferi TaxID=112525 RepID=A0AAD8FHU5_BIOPF|nr:cubilin-like isoform X2 [Biomphalaria pfeifferi]